MKPKRILGLVKIGEEKYIKSFFERGDIYMNTLEYFRKLEDKEGRGDKYEGADYIEQITYFKFESNGKVLEFGIDIGNIKAANIISTPKVNMNVLSMIGFSEYDINKENHIDIKNGALGDRFVVIYNVREFLKRVKEATVHLGLTMGHNFVSYYDEYKHRGNIGPFDKPLRFEYQKEFRIVVTGFDDKPLQFDIGNLSDIAFLGNIKDLPTLRIAPGK